MKLPSFTTAALLAAVVALPAATLTTTVNEPAPMTVSSQYQAGQDHSSHDPAGQDLSDHDPSSQDASNQDQAEESGPAVSVDTAPSSASSTVMVQLAGTARKRAPLPRANYAVKPAGTGGQALIDRCRGPVYFPDAQRYLRSRYLAEHWYCGGRSFPRWKGAVVRVYGAGLYRSAGIVLTASHSNPQAARYIPRGYDLYFQTCLNNNPNTTVIIALKRIG